jgi:predicted small lipoprotein YifL
MHTRAHRALTIALALTLVVATAACGVRGSLDLPEGDKAAETTAKADSGQNKPEGAAPKPHKGFILDGLLR